MERDATSDVEAVAPAPGRRWSEYVIFALLVGVAGFLFAVYGRYLAPGRPGVLFRGGWYAGGSHGQSDQYFYLRTARVFSHWRLPRGTSEYRYGLGYPVLAVPFIWLGFHGDPFAPLDALAFGATLALTFVLGTYVSPFRSRTLTLVCGIATASFVAIASPLLGLASQPWNSNIVVPLGLFVLVVAVAQRDVSLLGAIGLGLALGWIFATRYLDAFFLGLPAVALVVRSSAAQRRRLLIAGGGTLAVIVVLVFASQRHAFGNFLTTPYHFHTRQGGTTNDQSASEYRLSSIPKHFINAFITGKNDQGVRQLTDPLLRISPYLLLTPIGAYFIVRRRSRSRVAWISAIVGSVLGTMFYLSFVAGGGGDLQFDNARYWAPWYPLWAALAVLALAVITTRIAGHRAFSGLRP